MGATNELGDLQGQHWSVSGGKGHSPPLTGNTHTPIPACTSPPCSSPSLSHVPDPFFCLVHCLHIQVTPNRGTYLLPAPLELKGQWDKALRTGQSWSFFPHKVRRTAPLLLLPAPSACTVAPGITQGPSGLGHGGFRVHDTAPALRVPSMRTTEGTRFIRGSWHKGRQMPSGGHLLRWSGNAGWQGMKML